MQYDGVFENKHALDNIMRTFKIKKKDLFFASVDISNAFGTLPHWAIFAALRAAGAGEEFIDTVKNIYEDAETEFKTSAGLSTPRLAATGVRKVIRSVGCYLF